mmetsp:Transcript_28112/g.74352  ORF Transcript_28112/g.74352 Transcript_28112/m.74352 type:complete len:216 (+) Transcript_28112:1531-2178(+)
MPEVLDVPAADLRLRRHHAAAAHRGQALQARGRHVAAGDARHARQPQDHRRLRHRGPDGEMAGLQHHAGHGPEGPGGLPGDEAQRLRPLLLPLQRRAPRDPLADEGPDARAALPLEGLRGDVQGHLHPGQRDQRDDLAREREGPVPQRRGHVPEGRGGLDVRPGAGHVHRDPQEHGERRDELPGDGPPRVGDHQRGADRHQRLAGALDRRGGGGV